MLSTLASASRPHRVVPDRDGSGGAVQGFDCPRRAALPEGEWRSSGLSADGDAAYPSDAKLVRLQRSSDRSLLALQSVLTSVKSGALDPV